MDRRNIQGGGLEAAIAHFPDRRQEIAALFAGSEAFRTLCDDLAAAELALSRIGLLPDAVRDDRRLECGNWIAALSEEILQALAARKVVSLADVRRKRPPE